ncbi:MAG: hypothetical protein JSS98_10910, partial [Bacteroidetes bacterium]|nr:hypothetical protein [Bacteroidota bacterium]
MKAFRISSHLKFNHEDYNIEKYVQEFGEFRPKQLKVENNLKNKKTTVCKICNRSFTIRSMAMHLKWSHSLKTERYVEKYGEFRPTFIKNKYESDKSDIKCKICNEKMMHRRQLMHHLTKKHPNVSKREYVLEHELKGVVPLCKCGCGKETNFNINKDNYFNEYIKGHWNWVKPGYFSHKHETKMKIREARIEILKKGNFFQKISESEIEFQNFLKSHIDIETNNRTVLHGRELDIYIKSLKLAIEYNGIYFHSDK